MFNAQKVATQLEINGVAIQKVVFSREPELEDDEICVTDMISVQVGYDYLAVTRDHGDGTFTMYSPHRDVKKLTHELLRLTT